MAKPTRRWIIVLGLSALLAIGAALIYDVWYRDPVLARVGDYVIRQSDADYRTKINNIYYPHETERTGLSELKKYFAYAELLKRNNKPVTAEALKKVTSRIENNPYDQLNIAKVKSIFGSNHAAYERLYILPIYAEEAAEFELFAKSEEAQADSLLKVQTVIQDWQSQTKIKVEDFATEADLISSQYVIILQNQTGWIEPFAQFKQRSTRKGGVLMMGGLPIPEEIHSTLSSSSKSLMKNEVLPLPISAGNDWLVLIFKQKLSDNEWLFDAVHVPKLTFKEWTAKIVPTLVDNK